MKNSRIQRTTRRQRRRGAILVLVTAMVIATLAIGALAINWAYLELTRTQLQAATDAAAKAALVALSETQSFDLARRPARQSGQANHVAGQALLFHDDDIRFGNGARQPDGRVRFTMGQEPINSVRVDARRTNGSDTGNVSTFLSHFISKNSFEVAQTSAAARIDHDICVVVDRSGSMAWDLSGDDFAYPGESNDSDDGESIIQNYFEVPDSGDSRWAALINALAVFKTSVDDRNLNAQIALVSYSSDYAFGAYESQCVTLNQVLSKDTSAFLAAAQAIGIAPLIGDTNIAAGMVTGAAELTHADRSRFTAHRTMILLTDGNPTEGIDPAQVATNLVGNRITIHTITFSAAANQALMANVAAIGGGSHYHALTDTELQQAFRQIAEELPAVLAE